MNLDERLERIHFGLSKGTEDPVLPPRSKELSDRVEAVLNMYEAEKLDIIEKNRAFQTTDVDYIALERLNVAIKPAVMPWCQRFELRLKERIRQFAEWLFKVTR